ncbi:PREDICTED: protein lifeguard 1-like [Elephantulus edwardii]|uniref:protein lifeguard 1-like n=1 Tax=Elephantulus edwardii TaxID=28737 RepID=UPI0003F0A6A8|nr:PREDICTED: protein lifeguard 1-like [Elephantulus edwardii]
MDLEISEPGDFSSGDHLYLVQKAADRVNVESQADQLPKSSPDPKKHTENPEPMAGERSKDYVVQISEDSTTEDSSTPPPNPFSDKSIRRAFLRKVFLLLTGQLLITGAIISVFIFWQALRVWILLHPWFNYALLPAFFVVLLILACCGELRRQVPINYILLALFTILQGLLLGTVSVFYNAEEVLWAVGATALVTLALTLFALQTKWDFTLCSGVLFVFLFILLIFGILIIVIRSYWLHLIYAGLGTVVFSFYLVMDVQLMVGGHHHSYLNPEEYVFAALNIYLDIINLFLFILQLIGLAR